MKWLFSSLPKLAKAGQRPAFTLLLKYFEVRKAFRYYIKQMDSILLCIYSVIDHRKHQNVVRTSVAHMAKPHVPLFCS